MSRHYTGRIVKLKGAEGGDAKPGGQGTATPVLSEEEQAKTVLEQAQADADQLIAEAEERAAAILEEAEQQAIVRGKKAAVLKFLELSSRLEADIYSLEGEVANIVSDSVERILATTPKEDQLSGIVRAAIRDFRHRRSLELHVAEEDHAYVSEVVREAQKGKTHPIKDIKTAAHLSPGECQLTDGAAELRIDVDTQLAALRHALNTPESESADRLAS